MQGFFTKNVLEFFQIVDHSAVRAAKVFDALAKFSGSLGIAERQFFLVVLKRGKLDDIAERHGAFFLFGKIDQAARQRHQLAQGQGCIGGESFVTFGRFTIHLFFLPWLRLVCG